jgi:hypothetical protein
MGCEMPDTPVLRKICPYITYSNGTVFCKRVICQTANPRRFRNEGFCSIVITAGQSDPPGTGDND